MSFLKKFIPAAIFSSSAFYIFHYFFYKKFNPPEPEKGGGFETGKWKGITYLIENDLPYPTHINKSSNPRLSLDGEWFMRIDKGGEGAALRWYTDDFRSGNSRSVNIPSCFNTADSLLRDYEGAVWYQKHFTVNPDLLKPGNRLRLSFGGSAYNTHVWLNGRFIGRSIENGYAPFYFDITADTLAAEENNLTVRVNNKLSYDSLPPRHYDKFRLGWHCYGGIHKSVTVESCPPVYCFKLNPLASFSGKSGTVKIRALFHRPGDGEEEAGGKPAEIPVKFIIKDSAGRVCAEKEAAFKFARTDINGVVSTVKVSKPLPWSSGNPALYTLIMQTKYEELEVNFGFRTVAAEGYQVKINGEPVLFKGVSRHEENAADGLAMKPESVEHEMKLFKETGGNFVRLAHYPHSPEAIEYADRSGLYIWTEIPLYQAGVGFGKLLLSKTTEDSEKNIVKNLPLTAGMINQLCRPRLLRNAREQLLKLVERHMNHPSVIFWGLGNECWTLNPAGAGALKWLKEQVLQLDKSRLITYAALSVPFLTEQFERSFDVVDVIALNEYHGWYYGKPGDADKFVDSIHRRHPDKPILISETGSDCVYGEHDTGDPPKKGYSEEYQAYLLKTKWEFLSRKPWFCGWSIWVLKDFLCMEYLEDNPVPYYNLKGLIDRDYREKQSFRLIRRLYSGVRL